MTNKIRLKKIKKPHSIASPILMVITAVFIVSFLLIRYMGIKAGPIFLTYAQFRVEQLNNQIIHNAISEEVLEQLDVEKLFVTTQNSEGQIVSVDFNPVIVNRVLNSASDAIQRNLKALEKGELNLIDDYENIFFGYDIERLKRGVIYEIPFGVITNTSLLANLGPKIPVKFSLIGSLNTNIDTKIRNYGINNVIMEIFIHVDIINRLILPLMSKDVNYELTIPVATKVIRGEIPRYYQAGISQSSPILALPME